MSFILSYLMLHLVLGTAFSGCSQKCHPSSDPLPHDNSTLQSPPLFPCSCSPSCSVYRDCCYDSDYRDSNRTVKLSHTMCVTVNGTGKFLSVAKCPSHWPTNQFCGESIGYLPPVTSKDTGVTYANVYCAECHEDGENLETWNVELRCCPEHEGERDRYFSYRYGQLWSRLPKGLGRKLCLCRYHVRNDSSPFVALSVAAGPELRRCDARRETATCSSSWPADETSRLCPLYKDPVYTDDDVVYKNPHCARCNFEGEGEARCLPAVLARMFETGANFSEVSRHCRENHINACLHFKVGKGVEYSFSQILRIDTKSCVPEPGEHCCAGYRYHYKTKRCRKIE